MQNPPTDFTTWGLPEGAMARLGRGTVRDMAFSPDGQYLAERGKTNSITFSPDSRRIVTQTFAEGVKVWDIQRGVCIAVMAKPGHRLSISNPIFSPDGQRVLAATNRNAWDKNHVLEPGKVHVWCAQTGEQIGETEVRRTQKVGLCTAFSPNLTLLASTYCDNAPRMDNTSVVVWNLETGEEIACMPECPARVWSLCFSPCGKFLAVGGEKGTLHVWEWENEQLERTTEYSQAHVCLHYLPNGELLAAAVSPQQMVKDFSRWTVVGQRPLMGCCQSSGAPPKFGGTSRKEANGSFNSQRKNSHHLQGCVRGTGPRTTGPDAFFS